jgi:hypothetical protein
LVISLLFGFYGPRIYQIELGAAVLFFVLACIFIYEGATTLTTPRVVVSKDETGPQGPRTKFIKVRYAPITELVVHEVIEQDQTTFFQDIIRQMPPSPIYIQPNVNWVDGFALLTTQFPHTNAIIADNLAGRIHYQTVVFTRMPFHSEVSVKLGDKDSSVRLRKAVDDPNLVSLASFLKGSKPRTPGHSSESQEHKNAQDNRSVQIQEIKRAEDL